MPCFHSEAVSRILDISSPYVSATMNSIEWFNLASFSLFTSVTASVRAPEIVRPVHIYTNQLINYYRKSFQSTISSSYFFLFYFYFLFNQSMMKRRLRKIFNYLFLSTIVSMHHHYSLEWEWKWKWEKEIEMRKIKVFFSSSSVIFSVTFPTRRSSLSLARSEDL